MNTPIEITECASTMTPSTIFGAGADEAVVFDDRRVGLQRLEHAADADAAGEVDVLADLRARADGRPGVHHRALVDVGADVHVRRHQDDVPADEGAGARHGRRHDAKAALAELGVGVAGEAHRHLVELASSRRRRSPGCRASRKYSSTAFLIHWCVTHAPSIFSATRRRPVLSPARISVERLRQILAAPWPA